MKRIFAIALVAVGTPLELYFYWYRFTTEGMESWIAIVAGLGLVMLLSAFVYFARDNKWWLVPMVFLGAFDVISTSAGQSFATLSESLASTGVDASATDYAWQVEDAGAQIVRLDREYDALLAQEASIGTIEDRAKWRTALAVLDNNKGKNRAEREKEIARKERAISGLGVASQGRKLNIYSYYESLFNTPAKWVQFVLHTVLSVFLSCMTPVGVALWPKASPAAGVKGTKRRSLADIADNLKQRWDAWWKPEARDAEPVVSEAGPAPLAPRRGSRAPMSSPIALPKARKKGKSETEVAGELVALERIVDNVSQLPDLCDPRAIGKALEMSHTPVYEALRKGELHAESMNPVRIRKEEVSRWVEARMRNGADPV